MFVVEESLYICNINDLVIRPTFLLQRVLVACLNGRRCLAVWGARHGENVLGWYLQVEGRGCSFVQSENPCFGTCTKLGVINKNPSNLGLCLVPVTDHKPFPAPHHLSLHKSYPVCVWGQGAGRLRAF